MGADKQTTGIIRFIVLFAVFAPLCLAAWWGLLPHYAALLGAATVQILNLLTSINVDGYEVVSAGILHTATEFVLEAQGQRYPLEIGHLVTNLPLYAALVLATPALGWKRRIVVLAAGCMLLAAGHLVFLVLAFRFPITIAEAPQLPTAVGEAFITLPFMLWIVLAYWPHIRAFGASADAASQNAGPPAD